LASRELVQALAARIDSDHHDPTRAIRETHISWVILAGPFAYKIKKPVRFAFVDFTSLAARRDACLEELRLNRRLTPELYLDVLPIFGSTSR